MRRVIVESPYAGDVEANETYAQRCMSDSLSRGEAPFLSHLLYTQVLDDTDATQRDQGIHAGFAWRSAADATIVYVDRGVSLGMEYGIEAAYRLADHEVEYRQLGAQGTSLETASRYHRGALLALTGPAGSGKTTVAEHLVCMGAAVRVRFAGPLKDALVAMGLTREQVDGGEKEEPCYMLGGKTPRHAMQTIGTDWGREMIDDEIWVRCTVARILTFTAQGLNVVVDDARFDNEADMIRELGGKVISLTRDGHGTSHSQHASEAGICPDLVDHAVDNNGSIADTASKILSHWIGQ